MDTTPLTTTAPAPGAWSLRHGNLPGRGFAPMAASAPSQRARTLQHRVQMPVNLTTPRLEKFINIQRKTRRAPPQEAPRGGATLPAAAAAGFDSQKPPEIDFATHYCTLQHAEFQPFSTGFTRLTITAPRRRTPPPASGRAASGRACAPIASECCRHSCPAR